MNNRHARPRIIEDLRRGIISTSPVAVSSPLPAHTPRHLIGRVIWSNRRFALPAAAALIVHQIGEAMVPVIMGRAIDTAVVNGDLPQLLLWVGLLGLNFAMLSFSYRFGAWYGQLGEEAMQHHLRGAVTDRLLHPRARADRLPGSALSLATNDVRHVTEAIALVVYPAGQLAAILVGGVLLLVYSLPLGLAVLIGAPVLLVLLDVIGRPLRRRAEVEASAVADAAGTAADLLAGYRVLTGIRAQHTAAARYEQVSQRSLRATLRTRAAENIIDAGLAAISALFVVAIAVAAGVLALQGALSVGELITVVGLTQFLLAPLSAFASRVAPIWSSAQASARRVLPVLSDATTSGSEMSLAEPAAVPTSLVLDGVVLPSGVRVAMRVGAGEFVGVRADGAVGAELADVLAARTRPAAGAIVVGEQEVMVERPESTRAVMLVAPHEAELFDGTIEENLRLPHHHPDMLAAAVRASGCDEVLESVPAGWQTIVGEGGLRLSGGQRQRVALARALVLDAPVLVLHEPTTAVDSVTETAVASRVRELRAGRITVVLTTSPAFLSAADRVIEIAEGGVPDEQ